MRQGRCPKCQATTIAEVDTSRYADGGIILNGWSRAALTYYVCTTCGYTEAYVLDPQERAKIAKDKPHVVPQGT